MKNIVKCYKHFFGYFNALKTHSDYVLSSQTEKLMAGTKFSDYLGLNHYRKAKKVKHFIHLGLAQGPQSFVTYR